MAEKQMEVLPTRHANRTEMDAFYHLCGALDAMLRAEESLQARVRLMPGGWRDLRMIRAVTEKLIRRMVHTFEPEKRPQITRQMHHMRLRTVFGPEAQREPECMLLSLDDVGVLIYAASQECRIRLCMAGECPKCQLGKALDRVSLVSRKGRAWWEVLNEAGREEGSDGSDNA